MEHRDFVLEDWSVVEFATHGGAAQRDCLNAAGGSHLQSLAQKVPEVDRVG